MSPLEQRLSMVLRRHLGEILTRSVLSLSVTWSRVDVLALTDESSKRLLAELTKGVKLYVNGEDSQRECLKSIEVALAQSLTSSSVVAADRLHIPVVLESDIVVARTSGRELCRKLGFSQADQVKVATAISELARNILQYAGSGEIEITTLPTGSKGLEIIARDKGPGIASLDVVMSKNYRSRDGMGIGLKGVKRLMDEFEIHSAPDSGTVVIARKRLV